MTGWTVIVTKPGCANRTVRVPYMGAWLVEPRCHGCVSWFTTAVYNVVSGDWDAHTAVAAYSHAEKEHMDKPRDPKRIPQ